MKLLQQYTHTTAAIASTFHENGLYDKLYEKKADTFGGFPGLWAFFADLGEAYVRAERASKLLAGEDYEFIDAIDKMCSYAFDYYVDQLYNDSCDWVKVAERCIKECTYVR